VATKPLNANYRVSLSSKYGADLLVTLESRSGSREDPKRRNPDYIPRLKRILVSLRTAGCVIRRIDVISDNKKLANGSSRTLKLNYPIDMRRVRSVESLRLEIQAAQRAVGRAPGKSGGNNTKRIGIWVSTGRQAAAIGIRSLIQ
jgi:hypothetical protein